MPLSEVRLKNAIKAAMETAQTSALAGNNPQDVYAQAIAQAVIAEIKAMTITIVGTAGPNPIMIANITIT